MIVREARPEELETIRALVVQSYEQYASIMTPRTWVILRAIIDTTLDSTEPVRCFVAERDAVIVGSVLLFAPSADAYGGIAARLSWPQVRMLAVDPSARGLGIGKLLVEECVQRARSDGATALVLHTSVSMRAAMRLYTRMGFERVPAFDFQPDGGDELVEAYRLPL